MLMAADTRESFKILMPAAISNTMKPRNESIGKKNTAAGKSSSTAMKIQKSYSIIFARFYSCAVYSQKYADCEGFNLFPSLDTYIKPQLTGFAVGNNGMVYFTARYLRSIYSMDMKIVRNLNFPYLEILTDFCTQGQPSLKVFVKDPLLASVNAIAMNKSKTALFVTTVDSPSPSILRVSLDGTITTLYSNVTSPYYLLVTDLTHCQ